MARFKVQYKGNKALLSGLKKYKGKVVQRIGEDIEGSAAFIASQAGQKAPKGDTGYLHTQITSQYDASTMRARIEANMHYAPYVEFGTGGLVDVPQGLEEYAMRFKGKGVKQVNLPPRPFMYPAFREEIPRLLKNLQDTIKQYK